MIYNKALDEKELKIQKALGLLYECVRCTRDYFMENEVVPITDKYYLCEDCLNDTIKHFKKN